MDKQEAEEYASQLDSITLSYWHAKDSKDKAYWKGQYHLVWLALKMAGYRVKRKSIRDESRRLVRVEHTAICLAEEAAKPKRCRKSEFVKVDIRPDGKSGKQLTGRSGDCTVRALTYAFKGKYTYEQVFRKQVAKARLVYGNPRRWNCDGTWNAVLVENGFRRIKLHPHMSQDRLAGVLRSVEEPIVTVSNSHASILEHGRTVDSWDSRAKRILEIYAPDAVADRVSRILSLS